MPSTAAALTSGPISVPGSSGSPIGTCPYARTSRSIRLEETSRCDDDPARRRAALPRGADGAEQNRARRQIEPRVLRSRRWRCCRRARGWCGRTALRRPRATRRPTAVEPVNETSGRRGSCQHALADHPARPRRAARRSPCTPWSAITRLAMCCTATAQSGVGSAGFQTTGSPQTAAIAAFHAQTATGKLNAVMTPTGPSGCHCSIIRWPGRSDASVRP